ncbi:hypothetical protein SEA_CEPENS_60 [Mycobacterium phage Cepens]|nr:hypothetical protein SEA_CEPENS_60 [Mycobacterium phage Cepens]
MKFKDAAKRIGQKVVYRPLHVGPDQPGEECVITRVEYGVVFVRYGSDEHSKATLASMLEPVIP